MKNSSFKNYFLVLLITISLASCDDYLTKVIEYDDIGYVKQLVLNSKIDANSSEILISLSENINFSQVNTSNVILINGANITLDINGDVYTGEPFVDTSNDFYNYKVTLNNPALETKTISINASHPDFTDVSAEVFLGKKSEILELKYFPEAKIGSEYGYPIKFDEVKVTILDNGETENYYKFRVGTLNSNNMEFSNSYYATSEDIDAVNLDYLDGVMYEDNLFQGKEKSFSLLFQNYYSDDDPIYVEYSHISKADYLFNQSLLSYYNSSDFGFFAEPVTVFSNVNQGLGIVQISEKSLHLVSQ